MNDKQLCLWVPVWGQKHLDSLKDYALPSLMSSGNLPALGLEKIYVETIGVNHERAHTERVIREGLWGQNIEFNQHGTDQVQDLIHALRKVMRMCIERGVRMLVVMPDTIFATGSVANIFNYAKGKPVTVAAAHVRVNEDKFKERFSHWQLWPHARDYVRAAFQIGAVDVCDTNEDNVTRIGGIAWTKISDTQRLLLHYLPTPYLCWFTVSDEAWWGNHITWGVFDHLWPAHLLAERRLRMVGSTNVFFAMELESAERSGALKPDPGSKGGELYMHRNPHNDACGSLLVEVVS